jgi:hypothetical protein
MEVFKHLISHAGLSVSDPVNPRGSVIQLALVDKDLIFRATLVFFWLELFKPESGFDTQRVLFIELA